MNYFFNKAMDFQDGKFSLFLRIEDLRFLCEDRPLNSKISKSEEMHYNVFKIYTYALNSNQHQF
jgi:hypothetical protein